MTSKNSLLSGPVIPAVILLLVLSLALNVVQFLPKSPEAPAMLVPNAPQVAMLDAKPTLVYELYVSNKTPLEFSKIEVYDNSTGALLKRLEGDELNRSFHAPFRGLDYYIFFMWVEPADAPTAIYHKVYLKDGQMYDGAVTAIDSTPLLVIAPPLKGGNWLAANGPSNFVGHRTTVFNLNGNSFISQRYAIDFIQLGADGKMFSTDGVTNEDYPFYGADIYAVADGTVVDAKDWLADNKPGEKPVPTVAWAGGNYVVLDIGNGNYAYYAHMIPGSEKVKTGDSVRKGDVIGRLGSTGNSDLPHLHFHIMSGKDALFSQGKPYIFESYILTGASPNWSALLARNASLNTPLATPVTRVMNMPIDGDIITFVDE
ncbi:M23 family metallopeptidase [Candidatus Micrarchaeota archaeon]|nr:M23 family metallopeptidase [Candidatus Micrarchaeota archaeon]